MQEKKQKKIKASGTPAFLAEYLGGEGLTLAVFAGCL
jgi:hypothetical protein